MKASKIVNVIENLEKMKYKKVLINGSWGIGKTKYVKDYIDVNKSTSLYISLFGKKDISEVVEDIYHQVVELSRFKTLKKAMKKAKKNLDSIELSFFGVTMTLPSLNNVFKEIDKKINGDVSLTLVIDDIERKHKSLRLNEVFGLVDSLTTESKLRVVLVMSKDNLSKCDLKELKTYREKAIDREYVISNYSSDAPQGILGQSDWEHIKHIAEQAKLKNLRLFIKTTQFIKEVEQHIPSESFSEKFTRTDILKSCFAVVLFVDYYNESKELIKKEEDLTKAYYEGDSGTIDYICNYILENSFENDLSKNLLPFIIELYLNGEVNNVELSNQIDFINNFEFKPHNFYSSEEDITQLIDKIESKFESEYNKMEFGEIIAELNIALIWCEALDIELSIEDTTLLERLLEISISNIDLEKSIHENLIDTWMTNIESKKLLSYVTEINRNIELEYYKKLINEMKQGIDTADYSKRKYIKELESVSYNLGDKPELLELITSILIKEEFLFPLPKGKISTELWYWCHSIDKVCLRIGSCDANFDSKYNDFISILKEKTEDKMLIHRLNQLRKN